MSLIDFIKSKVEKESKEYFNRNFHHGKKQRDTIKNTIEKLFHNHRDFNLPFTYIVIKELHLKDFDGDTLKSKTNLELNKLKPRLNKEESIQLLNLISVEPNSCKLLSLKEYLKLVDEH